MRRVLAVAVIAIVAVLWAQGSLDRTLYPVGLNNRPCVVIENGSTLCGDELARYRLQQQRLRDRVQDALTPQAPSAGQRREDFERCLEDNDLAADSAEVPPECEPLR